MFIVTLRINSVGKTILEWNVDGSGKSQDASGGIAVCSAHRAAAFVLDTGNQTW